MTTTTRGTPVKSGYYFNSKGWTLTSVARDGELLPGAPGEWKRVPVALAIAAAPVLGGLFVVAFPFLGAVAIGAAVARKLGVGVRESAADLAANLAPGPLPGEAHLTGKPGEGEPAARSPEIDALAKEIEEKRRK